MDSSVVDTAVETDFGRPDATADAGRDASSLDAARDANADARPPDMAVNDAGPPDMGVPSCAEPFGWLAENTPQERFRRGDLAGGPGGGMSYASVGGSFAFTFPGEAPLWWDGTIPNTVMGTTTPSFAIEAWFRPSGTNPELVGPTFGNGGVALFVHMSKWALYVGGSGFALGTPVARDTWAHVVGTWTAGTPPVLKLYVNGHELTGMEVTTTTEVGSPATKDLSGPLRIGGSLPAGDRPFNGQIDDTYLHCAAPDAATVRMRCSAGAAAHGVTCATM